MKPTDTKSRFKAKLLRPAGMGNGAPWAFVILPKESSEKLPRRGRTTVEGTLNGHEFRATLEPDGQLSHWLRLEDAFIQCAAGAKIGDPVSFEIMAVGQEPEPEVPADLQAALAAAPEAKAVWDDTTTIARLDWIHWMTSAKQAKTREKRIRDACDMLASGKKRVCCFDPSGFYSKAFSAPIAEEG
ncbi:MAG: DUF1905 domain-containing protein [Verrucomicrobia bacterium]|nr:DUF1905 domain-containing protein [Verrucomicrobiota bacterium]MCH8528911.1 YdeI/OmpD-associated family protein [Kiritimatiellia bacterium]